jgi:phosphoglycerate dehydrogenase-like enzyme
MAKGKLVVFTHPLEPQIWDMFLAAKPADWGDFTVVSPDDGPKVLREMVDADYLVAILAWPVPPKIIEPAKHLKLLQTPFQGTEALPVKQALERGIFVANGGGANAISVAEHTMLLILSCLKRLLTFNRSTRDGKWRGGLPFSASHEFFGKTVGIIGFGNIGRRVGALCYAYGANIIYYEKSFVPYALRADMKAKPVTLDELLAQSDIVTMHVPSLTSTKKMLGWNEFTKMKPTAYFINTSRGVNVDEAALIRALKENRIAGAGIDVFEQEPTSPENPLLHMDNVVVTPHSAGATLENWMPIFETVWYNLELVAEGKPPINQIKEY